MKVKVTTVQIYEFEHEADIDEIHDSLMDNLLDGQDAICETSDTKFEYLPREILSLDVKPA